VEKRKEETRAYTSAVAGAVITHILPEVELDPELVREHFIKIGKGEVEVEPCFWFYVIVAMGRESKDKLKTSIPRCVVYEAIRRIVLNSINPNRHNWISLDKPANIILQYANRHKCQYTETDKKLVVQHARIVSAPIREWVRELADGVNGLAEHQSVSQSVLYSYLSKINYCK
jgi:hypothetical protein